MKTAIVDDSTLEMTITIIDHYMIISVSNKKHYKHENTVLNCEEYLF